MSEKKYTDYIIDGIIDGMTNAKQTRTDIAVLKQRLYELSAIEKERLTNLCDGFESEIGDEDVKELASRLLAEVQVASEREQNRAVKELIDKLSEDNDRPHLRIR